MREITYVYVIGRSEGPVKVGITSDLFGRLRQMQTGSHFKLQLLYAMPAVDRKAALYHEKHFHDVYDRRRLNGEWFNLDADSAIEGVETSFQIEEWERHKQWQRQCA